MLLNKKALLATIPSDSHSWNLVFMEFFLEENGYDVSNLGPNTPLHDIEKALHTGYYDMVVISSTNGHAYIEAQELAKRIRASATHNGQLFLGGKICTQTDPEIIAHHTAALKDCGFDEVFDDSVMNSFDRFQLLLTPPASMPVQPVSAMHRASA
ncbi:cobalamin B12-binding domain-containing protein [Leisingera sp. ANG59]|uniref:cobalamin B12-binding domain-containing protein n=1 Tax=Leisingera sp. ANG59 TaxID=2675221 RepID=UPI001574B8D9|nr:cobalamin-dependent protein [Leisingera sp. ANG59]NSY39775.1 methylaspartate mutase [Leisingera sp. ANG59]